MSAATDASPHAGRAPVPQHAQPAAGAAAWMRDRLTAPVDLASLAAFRLGFGLLLLWEVWRYLDADWVRAYYVDPPFNFTYGGLGWVVPLPDAGMHALFVVLGIVATTFAIGAYYRASAVALAVGYTYVFLLEQGRYLNHFYLICLFAWMMVLLPAHRLWSVDAWLDRRVRAATAPAWSVAAPAALLGIVFIFAGLAKIDGDWLAGEPLRAWTADDHGMPVIGPILAQPWGPTALSWAGAAFDLLVVPALLWRRTRLLAFLLGVGFHVTNDQLFSIGIFPWFAVTATTLYFRPDWPRRVLAVLMGGRVAAVTPRDRAGGEVEATTSGAGLRRAAPWVLAAFLAVQVLVPLRHHLIPGDVAWTEEGHRFSWRMKLRSKSADATFIVSEPASGASWTIDPGDHLTSWQERNMATRPDMVAQFARFLRVHYADQGVDVQVRATVVASLNGRPEAPLVDPTVDLSRVPAFDLGRDWIEPHPGGPPGSGRSSGGSAE